MTSVLDIELGYPGNCKLIDDNMRRLLQYPDELKKIFKLQERIGTLRGKSIRFSQAAAALFPWLRSTSDGIGLRPQRGIERTFDDRIGYP